MSDYCDILWRDRQCFQITTIDDYDTAMILIAGNFMYLFHVYA